MKKMIIPVRCYGANDNLCDKIMNHECSECNGCAEGNQYFEINEYDEFFTVNFYHKIGDIEIIRCSERIDKKTFKLW